MISTILLIINTLGIAFLVFSLFKNKQSDNADQVTKTIEGLFDRMNKILKEEMSLSRKEMADSEKRLREEISNLFKGFGDSFDKRMSEFAGTQNKNFEGFSTKLTELIDKNDARMEKVREVVEKKLESLQKDNEEKMGSTLF